MSPTMEALIKRNEQLRLELAAATERFIKAFSPAQPPAQPTIHSAGIVAGKEVTR